MTLSKKDAWLPQRDRDAFPKGMPLAWHGMAPTKAGKGKKVHGKSPVRMASPKDSYGEAGQAKGTKEESRLWQVKRRTHCALCTQGEVH